MADDDDKKVIEEKKSDDKSKKNKKKRGIFSRIWNAVFRLRSGDDFEKRLQFISKEEATLISRMKRRSLRWRITARNLIIFSFLLELVAVGYAIMTTRTVDLDWRMRSLRVFPMFLLPAISFALYYGLSSFTKYCDRRDQKTLEKLRAERQAKIDELKERTNYYITQQLIQKYDPDPAAKAAAASVLASKLGADSGLKARADLCRGPGRPRPPPFFRSVVLICPYFVRKIIFFSVISRFLGFRPTPLLSAPSGNCGKIRHCLKVYLGDESQSNPYAAGKSNDVEVQQSTGGLRKRNQSNSRSPRINAAPLPDQNEAAEISQHGQLVVDHHNPAALGGQDGGWVARIAALLVGEDPTQSYALICGNCHMHNGLARKEEFPFITYYCPHCHALNKPKNSASPSDIVSPVSGSPNIGNADAKMIEQINELVGEKVSAAASKPIAAPAVEEKETSDKQVAEDFASH